MGGRIVGAKMRAETSRQETRKATLATNRAEAESIVHRYGRLWRASSANPTIGQCLNGGYG